ncbi:MAG TPA: thiamine pyrophosphate-binding protein [Burkholderiales bacterium]|nr:thiamine pyrophosphate-binding protein [Burkholderiales bacterium]
MITGAQAIVDCLKREGIDHVFGIPGTMNLPILDVLRATPEIRFVLTRHEQGAAFMAYGFARTLHRPAVVTATEGPGVTNLVTGIGAAYKGCVPVISISGAQELFVREKDASQDIDQVTLHRSITKWAYSIPSVGKIQEAVRRAFRVALAEPLGPVHLDVSRDILMQQTEPEAIAPEAYRPASLPACAAGELDRSAELIAKAERPILLAGGGVLREGALAALQRLAEATGIPVATLQYHPDAFPTSHPLSLGPLGRNGYSSANRAMPQADVVVALGAHIDTFSTSFKYGIISKQSKLIHHSPVATDIGVVFPVAQAVAGSTASFIDGLTSRLAGKKWRWADVAGLRRGWDVERKKLLDPKRSPILPPVVAAAVREALPKDGIVIVDAGNAGKHMRVFMDTYQPDTYMYTDDWGSVGAAFPIAMGAKLAAEAAGGRGARRHGHDVQPRRAGDGGSRAHPGGVRGVQRLRPRQRARLPERAVRRAHLRGRLRRRRLRRARPRARLLRRTGHRPRGGPARGEARTGQRPSRGRRCRHRQEHPRRGAAQGLARP